MNEPLGYCCYGGMRPKSACASCAAWAPMAGNVATVRTGLQAEADGQTERTWTLYTPLGDVAATETTCIRAWARIQGYKPTVEGLLAFEEKGWRVVQGAPAPNQAEPAWPHTVEGEIARYIDGWNDCIVAGEFQTVRKMTREDYNSPLAGNPINGQNLNPGAEGDKQAAAPDASVHQVEASAKTLPLNNSLRSQR